MQVKKAQNIDDFIRQQSDNTQKIMQQIRKTIQNASPQAKEKISYGIPTFELNGKNLIHFSAYDKHIGLYPGAQAIVDFSEVLKPYKTSKGTIQFPLDKPMPYDLIKKITLNRLQSNLNK